MTSTLNILKQIIDVEMEMSPNRVWAYNGNQNLPQDNDMFIVLSFIGKMPYYNNSKQITTGNGIKEYQSIGINESILISVVSKSIEARERCYEVLLALKSQYSQKIQEKYHIHISTINDCLDSSFLEATARLNRFDIRCNVIRSYSKIKDIDYYDKFSFNIKVENQSDNIIESSFNINKGD